jgi:carboxymethylenebutenolidase
VSKRSNTLSNALDYNGPENDIFQGADMADDQKDQLKSDIGRRDFVALSVAAGMAAGSASAAGMEVVETDVDIKMPDGTCDAAFIHPKSGSHPGVLIWTDVFGLRPSMREIGKRVAAQGYSVLVPNPYYRVAKNSFTDASTFSFQTDRPKLAPLTASIAPPGNIEKDAVAYIAFLDAQKQVNTKKKIGTQGYCMGGPLVVRTCATVPDRVGAGASFHGGGLVTKNPDSPHLLASKIKGRMYFGIGSNDDKSQPDAKDKLKESFEAANVPAEIKVYASLHGWCVPDMPPGPTGPIYNQAEADIAFGKLVELYKAALA